RVRRGGPVERAHLLRADLVHGPLHVDRALRRGGTGERGRGHPDLHNPPAASGAQNSLRPRGPGGGWGWEAAPRRVGRGGGGRRRRRRRRRRRKIVFRRWSYTYGL